MKNISTPKGVFKGVNFMTPNVIGYFKLRVGYAEMSEGRGIENEKIFGVTVRSGAGELDARSKMLHSRAAAEAYIEELS